MNNVDNLFEGGEEKQRRYSPSMFHPIFDPEVDGKDHQIFELTDIRRYKEALRMIEATDGLTDDERDFFKLAATRFIVFNFTSIAEKYCVSSPAARSMYEKLALVFVSYTEAIANALIDCDGLFKKYVSELEESK